MATILVVDDRAINREFLITLLGYAGHDVLEAPDADQALRLIRAHHPDLVIADVLMPSIDGFEFVRLLRGEPDIAQTRVMFYTATYMEGEARELADACGVRHVLTKPAEPQLILDTVQLALDTPAAVSPPPSDAEFDQEHGRLLLNKLAQKVDELETLSADLEQRVRERTAELDALNEHLRGLNALKDEFLAITSHDLRSPLGAIINMAELLLEDSELPEETRRRLIENIYELAKRQIELVSRLLDLARLESGKVELEMIELRASEVARQSIKVLSFSAQAKDISIDLVVEPGEPQMLADWMKLSQILNNLLSNAIKFTQPGGRVVVTVAPEPDGVRLSVLDSGLGIPVEALPHVFEKFRQVHTQGTANERGSGLGLAIVRQLVELHGGSIEVTSTWQQGSTFIVHLPANSLASSVSA
ncbi:MAG TPA: hybrid sensor histidine kinase/response regulator [Roseiflexaceae bacterium]|nr:hybrid sensor histidine kinase/response regulator [Roseiflexaceae bacterium]